MKAYLLTEMATKEFPPCETLRKIRTAKNLSQVQLAIAITEQGLGEVGSNFISRFETGGQKPWKKARAALSRALDVPENELFPELSSAEFPQEH